MKVAVASNNHVNVSGHLGRCKAFVVFETNENEILNREIRENTFRHHEHHGNHEHHEGHQHEHGEGHSHNHNALIEIIKDCDHVIFQSGGWRVIEDLKASHINPILTDEGDAEEAVKKFLTGSLVSKEDNTCRNH